MLVLSNRISFVLAATFACLAHGAEFPTALEGEVVSQKDGWRNTVAVRGLSFTEGRLAGRGDLSVKPPTHANKHCMRIDTAINGTYSLAANGSIDSMVVVFPSPAGPRCDPVTVNLVFDPSSGAYVRQTESWKWTLRIVK